MNELTRIILFAIAAFLCLAVGIIVFVILYQRRVLRHQEQMREFNRQKQFELMQASLRGEEEERLRIASELHDDVGATLSSVRLFLTQAELNPDDVSLIRYSKSILDESIQKIRDLSHQLQPKTLQYLGLAKTVESLADMLSRSGAISVSCVPRNDFWTEPDVETALSAYRIVQELINNVIKHAGATWLTIRMLADNGNAKLILSHDGNGLTEETYRLHLNKKGAIGLKNIENRLKFSSLSLLFSGQKGGNCTITLCLPQTPPTL